MLLHCYQSCSDSEDLCYYTKLLCYRKRRIMRFSLKIEIDLCFVLLGYFRFRYVCHHGRCRCHDRIHYHCNRHHDGCHYRYRALHLFHYRHSHYHFFYPVRDHRTIHHHCHVHYDHVLYRHCSRLLVMLLEVPITIFPVIIIVIVIIFTLVQLDSTICKYGLKTVYSSRTCYHKSSKKDYCQY